MEKREFIVNVIYYGIVAAIVYVVCKYLLPVMTPFIVGFLIAYVAHEVSKNKTEGFSKTNKIILLVVIYIVFAAIITLAGAYVVEKIKLLINWLSSYSGYIEPLANDIYSRAIQLANSLPKEIRTIIVQSLSSIVDVAKNVVLTISSYLVTLITGFVTSLPSIILSVMVAIIASFYILIDYEKTVNGMKKIVPTKAMVLLEDLWLFIKNKLFKILRSYIMIMALTFVELLVGFWILRVNSAGMLAALIAVLDILPVLGVGTVLLPWFVADMILGKYLLGAGILVLYLVITMIRNVVEPKMVGGDLGLDPLPTLVTMIVGLQLFGVLGMFGIPLTASFILYRKNLHNESVNAEA